MSAEDSPEEARRKAVRSLEDVHAVRVGWHQYRSMVITPNAGRTQITETRRAFYAGAMHIMTLMGMIGDLDISEEAGAAVMESIANELDAFGRAVGTPEEWAP